MGVGINNYSTGDVGADFTQFINSAGSGEIKDVLSELISDFSHLFNNLGAGQFSGDQGIVQGGCCEPPVFKNHCHPQGSLQTDGSVVTTPGGYKVESTGQYEWSITGPDGKTTKVWGDPHVVEGDGGKWDFKRDSTFVLGDGTKINVSTKPYGNGATVTSNLEIISGNDRVNISDIDKGTGVVGKITEDGYSRANSFGGSDVFVMGKESDDWSYQGQEIKGSSNNGETFQLGDKLDAGNVRGIDQMPVNKYEQQWAQFMKVLLGDFSSGWNHQWRPNNYGSNPYYHGFSNHSFDKRGDNSYESAQHQRQIARSLHLMGRMFHLLGRLNSLNDKMYLNRNRSLYA